MGLRILQAQTLPIVETGAGARRPASLDEPVPWALGWCNVIVVEINGQRYELPHNAAAGA